MKAKTYDSVLVAFDFSEHAKAAFREALRLARGHKSQQVYVCHVCEDVTDDVWSEVSFPGKDGLLADLLESALREVEAYVATEVGEDSTLNITVDVVSGEPAHAIVRAAKQRDAQLIVAGASEAHGLERVLTGNTAMRLVRLSPVDVMVVEHYRPEGLGAILVATDLSDNSAAALAQAAIIATEEGAALHLIHTYRVPRGRIVAATSSETAAAVQAAVASQLRSDLDAFVARVLPDGPPVETHLVEGQAVPAISELASSLDCGLLALGAIGRRGIWRILLGSTVEKVLKQLPRSILVVKPQVGPGDA